MIYMAFLAASFLISAAITFGTKGLMARLKIVDKPQTNTRKIHQKIIPLGGGLAIYVTLSLVSYYAFFNSYIGSEITKKHLFGIFIAGLVIMIGGFIDDKLKLRAIHQIAFPIAAALIVMASGIGIETITNPLGGTLDLSKQNFSILGNMAIIGNLLVFIWLMTMMFTTKLLDGLDGLVTGLVTIGSFVIFFLSLQDRWFQPEVATLSIIFAGACLGFLIWNWFPAKIFLGEGGSLFAGFMLAILAIISGGKVATALLVMGFPMLDMIRVIIRRAQKKKHIFEGDSEHLHFKLLHSGLNQKQAVLLFYAISLLFGATALFLQSSQQLVALLLLFILMLLIGMWFSVKENNQDLTYTK